MLAEEVTRSLYEFLAVYIHAIAYVCRVYPDETFDLVRQYGTATYQNRHSGVKHWIEGVAESVLQMIYSVDESAKAVVSIGILENNTLVERVGMEITEFVTTTKDTSKTVSEEDLVAQYRGCLTKLLHQPRLNESTNDRAMTVFFEGHTDGNRLTESLDWIVSGGGDRPETPIIPIRSAKIFSANNVVLVLNIFRQEIESNSCQITPDENNLG